MKNERNKKTMDNLKTLKDLEFKAKDFYVYKGTDKNEVKLILPSDAREEAIKWIKYFRLKSEEADKRTGELAEGGIEKYMGEFSNCLSFSREMIMVGEFFKDFFNITEEDLK